MTDSVPPYWVGGTGTQGGATSPMRMAPPEVGPFDGVPPVHAGQSDPNGGECSHYVEQRCNTPPRWKFRSAQPVALVVCPGAQQAPVVRDEVVVLVRRERRADGVHDQPVEVGALHVLQGRLVEARHAGRAELGVPV